MRVVPVGGFFIGPGRTILDRDECISAVLVPTPTQAWQQFSKVGPRNAMVIAVASFALSVDRGRQRVGTGMGSVGPTPLRAPAAERFLEELLWGDGGVDGHSGQPVAQEYLWRFGELVAQAARPIDDVRGTSTYRRRVLSTIARRTAAWTVEAIGSR